MAPRRVGAEGDCDDALAGERALGVGNGRGGGGLARLSGGEIRLRMASLPRKFMGSILCGEGDVDVDVARACRMIPSSLIFKGGSIGPRMGMRDDSGAICGW